MAPGRLYREQGVVLRTIKLGDADRIVSFVTPGRGKVRAVAKGVRKTKSRFGGRLEPVSHVAIQCYEGRSLDTVTQAESIDHFRAVREDLQRVTRATTLLEVVDQVSQEGEADPRLYQMLVGALRALEARDAPLLVGAFFLKLLDAEGLCPVLGGCVVCGEEVALVAFDITAGGVLCRSHRSGLPISGNGLELMRRILGGGLTSALAEPDGPLVTEVTHLATVAMETHLERRLRSISVLDQ